MKPLRFFKGAITWRYLATVLLVVWWFAFIGLGVVAFLESESKHIITLNELHRKERLLLNNYKQKSEIRDPDEGDDVDIDMERPSQASESELPFAEFNYPMNVNMTALVQDYREKGSVDIKPINPFEYNYNKIASDRCFSSLNLGRNDADEAFLLFLIKSATGNYERRQAIRQTWAKEDETYSHKFKSVFLLGITNNESIQNIIDYESIKYNDIVQMDFSDNYYSNTIKTMGGIHWAVKYCINSKFVMVMDDDFYVGTDAVLSYLIDLQTSNIDNLYMGNVFDFPRPYRSPKSKWHMSVSTYPYDKYPSFVSAGAILMSMEFAKKIQIAMQYTKKFIYDDIFMAIVVHKLGVIPIGNRRFHTIKVDYKELYFDDVLVSHGYGNPKELHLAWRCVKKGICATEQKSSGSIIRTSLPALFYTLMLAIMSVV